MNIGNLNPFLSFHISAWSWARPNSIHRTSRNRCPRPAPSSDAPWMATTTVGWYPSIRKVCATTHKSHYATVVFPPTQAQLSSAQLQSQSQSQSQSPSLSLSSSPSPSPSSSPSPCPSPSPVSIAVSVSVSFVLAPVGRSVKCN